MDVTGDNPASDNMLTGTRATGANGVTVNGALVTASPSDTNPAMDGTASAGSATTYSRGDHVHPSDTSKLGTSGNASSTTVTFTQASTRTNIATGTTLATAFSRISKWLADLGTLAFKSSVSASYTPAGSVTAPTISVSSAGSTTTVNSITAVGTLPSCTLPTLSATVDETNEKLILNWTAGSFSAGTLPTKGSNTTVKTGDASYTATTPTFSGTAATISSS
jgi:hypothetical protein